MMKSFPEWSQISVSPTLAADLFHMTTKVPPHNDKELYNVALQASVREQIRATSPDGFDWLVEEIRTRLTKKPYCAHITGLRFDKSNLLFVALSSAFGDVVEPYNQPWSQLVRSIQTSTDLLFKNQSVNERLHTDGTDWQKPNDLTCLLCVRPDQHGGGYSHLLDVETFVAELRKSVGTEALNIFYKEPIPWRIADELGGSVFWAPVFAENSLRWSYYTIDRVLQEGLAHLPKQILISITAMERRLKAASGVFELPMEASELLIIHNKRCLHARTPVRDSKSSARLVLRIKVRRPENWSSIKIKKGQAWAY